MTAGIVGALRVVLGMDSAAFEKGAGAAEKRIARMERSMRRAGRQMQRAGTRMAAAISLPLVGIATKAVAAQKEQERAIAAVTAALNSMGDGAGYTLSQLEEMASALQSKSLYGDEEILNKVTANLLTFGNISGDVFARAQQMAVDLSARLGQDLQSSAIMLGKALNDPIQGLSALSRVGIQFSEDQKAMIRSMAEAGDIAGAQAIMMAELEKQYSGQAAALAQTDSGRIAQAWNAIGDALEKVGAIILPIMAKFADRVKDLAEKFQGLSPETQTFIVAAGALAAALGPVVIAGGLVVSALAPLAGIIAAVISPMGALAAGAVAAAVAIYANWDRLREQFPAITGVVEAAIAAMQVAFESIKAAVAPLVAGMIEQLRLMAQTLEALLSGDLAGAIQGLRDIAQNILTTIAGMVDAMLGDLDERLIAWAVALPGRVRQGFAQVVDAIRSLGADMLAALGEALIYLRDEAVRIGGAIIEGIQQGIADGWDAFKAWFMGKLTGMVDGVLAFFGIKSPSRLFRSIGNFLMQGLQLGVGDGAGGVMQELAGVTQGMTAGLAAAGQGFDSLGAKIGRVVGEGIRGLKGFRGILAGVLEQLAKFFAQSAMQRIAATASGIFGKRSFAGGLVTSLLGGLLGFADGGSFAVGGAGGIDSQLVAFRASPDERVTITKPGQVGAAAGVQTVRIELANGLVGQIVDTSVAKSAQVSVQLVQAGAEDMRAGFGAMAAESGSRGV